MEEVWQNHVNIKNWQIVKKIELKPHFLWDCQIDI